VKEQLAGKRIMITGTTGFLGKVVIEKMIREIPDVEKNHPGDPGKRSVSYGQGAL